MKSSNNSKENTDNPLSVLESIQQYFFENLLSVLSIASLLFGGIIFWLYFFQIQYFPDLNFNESVLFLLVAAITGGYILVITAFVFMSPYIIRGVLKASPPNDKEMTSDNELAWYFCSMLLFYLAFFLYFFLENKYKISYLSFIIPGLIFLGIILGHFRVYSSYDWIKRLLLLIEKKVFRKSDEKNDKQEPKEINMFGPWVVSVIFMLLILGLIIEPSVDKTEPKEVEKLALMGILLFVILVANYAFACFQESTKKTLWHWTIPFLMVFLIFFFVGKPVTSQIPKIVMKKYKFGNFTAQRLLVDEKGCEILEGFELNRDFAKDKKTCRLDNIIILSRVGRSFYLKKTRKSRSPLCFTIPNEQVLSWSIEPDKQKNPGKDKNSNSTQTSSDNKKEAIACE